MMIVVVTLVGLIFSTGEVYRTGSSAEEFRRRSVESLVEYAYFSTVKSRAPETVLRLMAVDRGTYGSERHVMRHFQEVMREEVQGILSQGLTQAKTAMDRGKEELQRVLEVGLEGRDEYVALFKNFAKIVRGEFYRGLPRELQCNFSKYFAVQGLEGVAVTVGNGGGEMIGREVVVKEEERVVEERGNRLRYKWKIDGNWKFILTDKMAINDELVYVD